MSQALHAGRMNNGDACLGMHESEEGACLHASRGMHDAEATELTEATDDVTASEAMQQYNQPVQPWQVSQMMMHSLGLSRAMQCWMVECGLAHKLDLRIRTDRRHGCCVGRILKRQKSCSCSVYHLVL